MQRMKLSMSERSSTQRCQNTRYTHINIKPNLMKKALGETQTLRAGCSKAQTPSWGARRPKCNQLEMVTPAPTDPVWWGSMHAISSNRGNRPTNTHKPTERTDYNALRAASLARSVINSLKREYKNSVGAQQDITAASERQQSDF